LEKNPWQGGPPNKSAVTRPLKEIPPLGNLSTDHAINTVNINYRFADLPICRFADLPICRQNSANFLSGSVLLPALPRVHEIRLLQLE